MVFPTSLASRSVLHCRRLLSRDSNPRAAGLKLASSRFPLALLLSGAFAIGAACAQTKGPEVGTPGKPIRLVVGFQPYYILTWTAAIARDKEFWRERLPAGSRVHLNVAIRGSALAAAMLNGSLHIGYGGDPAVTLAAAGEPDVRLVAVAALSQDQCVILARANAPNFASPREAVRWLAGKRFALAPDSCMERVARAAFEREGVRPAQMLNLRREELHAAFREKRLDAAALSEPGASHLVADGLARRIYSSLPLGQWDGGYIIVPSAFLAARPDIVRGWLAAELRAQRFLADPRNADEAIRIVAAHATGIPPAVLWLALQGAYPARQGGSAVRLTFPFTFSPQVMSAVHAALKPALVRGTLPAGELRTGAIQSRLAEEVLRAGGLRSPLGEVRARASIAPR